MAQEDKELLFKDLSARLPYHVRCKIWLKDGTSEEGPLDLEHNYADVLLHAFYYNNIKEIKPYLRPLSLMTVEEKKEYYKTFRAESYGRGYVYVENVKSYDWLNAHHFDFRGLIEKGLAIEVTEEMHLY